MTGGHYLVAVAYTRVQCTDAKVSFTRSGRNQETDQSDGTDAANPGGGT